MSSHVRRRVIGVTAGLAAAVLLAACSSSSAVSSSAVSSAAPSPGASSPGASSPGPSAAPTGSAGPAASGPLAGLAPTRVLAKAQSAMSGAKSVHFVASGTGQTGGTTGLDLHLLANGDAAGSFKLATQPLEIVRKGTSAYLSGDPAFMARVAPGRTDLAGRWVKLPADDPAVADLLAVADLRTGLGGVLLPKGPLTFGPTGPVDGHDTVAIVESGPSGGIVHVAADATPYPLLVESLPGAASNSTARFSEWDQPVTITAPPAAQVIPLAASGS